MIIFASRKPHKFLYVIHIARSVTILLSTLTFQNRNVKYFVTAANSFTQTNSQTFNSYLQVNTTPLHSQRRYDNSYIQGNGGLFLLFINNNLNFPLSLLYPLSFKILTYADSDYLYNSYSSLKTRYVK